MEEKNYTGIVPDQHTGKPIDVASSVELDTQEQAKEFYEEVKTRLQNVNAWHDHAGTGTADFQLMDEFATEVNRPVQKGDYFKIDIPGPGNVTGDGYDWVQIEDVQETSGGDIDSFGLRVRPSTNPKNKNTDTAHFYSPESTSSFTVTRERNKITVGIYDRNTKANKDADNLVDKVRDAVVGNVGVAAFSSVQWKALADGLLKK